MASADSDDECIIIDDDTPRKAPSKATQPMQKTNGAKATVNSAAGKVTEKSASTSSQAGRNSRPNLLQQRSYSESVSKLDNIDSFLASVGSSTATSSTGSSSQTLSRTTTPLQRHASASGTIASFSTRGLVERAARDVARVDTSHLRERFIHLDAFSLKPNEYDIILIIDTGEVANSSIGGGRSLISELLTAGMQPGDWIEKRLPVGDFLWIAREKVAITQPVASSQPLPAVRGRRRAAEKPPVQRELVLDYIIERKRLDDLSQSICDGRFREQKARLSECGLRRPIYLIEKYAIQQNHGVSESNLRQAIIDTQIIDNFHIKETPNVTGTAQYLQLMTETLKQLYANKTLDATYLHDQLVRINSGETLDEDDLEVQLITYEEFSAASRKQRNWTIKELWLRQLVQIKGMSWEKAIAIIHEYPTPSRLFQAYAACGSEREKQDLLSTLKFGLQQRNVGKAISMIVYRIYNTRELLPAVPVES